MRDCRLTRRQETALAALLVSPTVQTAAKASGVSEASMYRWLSQEAFVNAYRAACKEAVQRSIGTLQAASSMAVECLLEVMADRDNPAGTRVTAARTILETAYRAIEIQDALERVERLESLLQYRRAE